MNRIPSSLLACAIAAACTTTPTITGGGGSAGLDAGGAAADGLTGSDSAATDTQGNDTGAASTTDTASTTGKDATGNDTTGNDTTVQPPLDAGPGAYKRMCDPCVSSSDCKEKGHETACIDRGKVGRFCGRRCDTENTCPGGYACKIAKTSEDISAKYCVPVDTNDKLTDCRCSATAAQAKLSTPCWKVQLDSKGGEAGKCPGKRTCNGPLLSVCQMSAPDKEVCDGIDNDCDGFVDPAGTKLCQDSAVCKDGKCVKQCKPQDGGWSLWKPGTCDKPCGAGMMTSTRTCTSPAPNCGGKKCVGDATKKEACNTHKCPQPGSELPLGKTVYASPGQVVKGTVPAGKTKLTVHVWGGGGGGGAPGIGGGGAFVEATIAVKPGDAVELRVASGGVAGGGGGGASYVFVKSQAVLVAGGGGGAGWDGCSGCSGPGLGDGGGGGNVGGSGLDGKANNKYGTGSAGGKGGTQSAGGAGGKSNNTSKYTNCTTDGQAGKANVGGPGNVTQCKAKAKGASFHLGGKIVGSNGAGGDGGAGHFGGGSGAAMYTYSGGGGGGGSSFTGLGVTLVSSQPGAIGSPGGASNKEYAGKAGAGGAGQTKAFGAKPEAGKPGRIVLQI